MIKHIGDFWSCPEGIYDYHKIKSHKSYSINDAELNSRVVIFSDWQTWEKHGKVLKDRGFKGVIIIPGDLLSISRIVNQFDMSEIQRIIACRVINNRVNNHTQHRLLLVINFTSDKRPYREIREKYTYCPLCKKGSKDYGGKKHHYPSDGTWIRDVWNKFKFSEPLISDTLFLEAVHNLYCIVESDGISIIDGPSSMKEIEDVTPVKKIKRKPTQLCDHTTFEKDGQKLILGDCSEILPCLAENREKFDLIFVDPPYNLGKKYESYKDNRDIVEYTGWCTDWMKMTYPLLDDDGFFVILNTPLNILLQLPEIIKHFYLVEDVVWDDLAVPVAKKMQPTYYSLIFMSKKDNEIDSGWYNIREPVFCKRKSCIDKPASYSLGSSIWSDIHRTRQKSKRWGHPCNLPDELVTRIIDITKKATGKDKLRILDFFSGVGTTTMASLISGNNSTGIELSEEYFNNSKMRLEHRYLQNPNNGKQKRATNGTKRHIQRLVAKALQRANRVNAGYSTQEQIEWMLENDIISKRDLVGFIRPGELLKAVGKGGAPGEAKDNQSYLTDYVS